MFVLAQIQDIVRVAPTEFRKDSESAILAVLNRKYANHVLHQVGLCIEANDITSSTDFLVHACQDGAYQSTIVFNLVVFRPFIGQVLMGRIKNSSPVLGIQVSVEFFDDIFIPPEFLMPGTVFDPEEGVWIWKYEGNDLFMDTEELIRFRVETELFVDVGPARPVKDALEALPEAGKQPPYKILGSIAEQGLGLSIWWDQAE